MVEVLGWIANLLFFVGGTFKNPRITMAFGIAAQLLYVMMYFYMNLFTAAFALFIAELRSICGLTLSKKHNLYSVVFFTIISCSYIIYNMDHAVDILIVFASIAIGTQVYFRDNFLMYRFFSSVSQVLWIWHSLIFDVPSMLFCCLMLLVINICAVLYYSNIKLFKIFSQKQQT